MSKKLTLLVPAFLTVFALLASSAATAQATPPKEMPSGPSGMWDSVKSQMKLDNGTPPKRHGMVLAIDVQRLLSGDPIAEAVHGWFAPGKADHIPSKPGDPFSEDLAGTLAFSINVLVHGGGSHICWQIGGVWKCLTY